jgi:hypothetical protein
VLAVTSLMLEAIRQIYETERQPETLAEASTYLIRLTEGRYQRVWTPLSEDILRVDTAHGESLPLDVLSQGTREAVFLSLRLALAAAYARRGALLPLVLDDVLVNLDVKRAKMAAEVLRDFANAGHQMMLFTCHHHILRIFQSAGVEVRLLPVRDGLDEADWADEQEVLAPDRAAQEEQEEEDAYHELQDDDFEDPAEDEETPEQQEVGEIESVADLDTDDEDEVEEDEEEVEEEVEEVEHEEEDEEVLSGAGDEDLEDDPLEESILAEQEVDDDGEVDDSAESDEPLYALWDDQEELHLADEDEPLAALHASSAASRLGDRWWETRDASTR